jgi:hypothetical protein
MFESKPPRRDGSGVYWDWLQVDLGKAWKGWLAGAVVGVETHFLTRTLPCRSAMTGGSLKCFCDGQELATRWKGYVPLWDECGIRCFVIICDRYFPLASEIKVGQPVQVMKMKRQGSPIRVEAFAWTSNPPPVTPALQKPQDMRAELLRLWKDKELTAWIKAHPDGVPLLDQAMDSTSRKPSKPHTAGEVADLKELLSKRHRAVDAAGPALIGDVLPHLNGKGRK